MTPAGTSNELDVQNGWEENTTHIILNINTIILNINTINAIILNINTIILNINTIILNINNINTIILNINTINTIILNINTINTRDVAFFRVFLVPFSLYMENVVCVCVFFPFILDIKFVGRTSRGHTGFFIHHLFCGACLNFSREKDSAIPFPSSTEKSNFVY